MRQKEFLGASGSLNALPLRDEAGGRLGWVLSRNDITLERNRGGARLFKSLDSVVVFCSEHKIESLSVAKI